MQGLRLRLSLNGGKSAAGGSFSPSELFAASEVGYWYEIADLGTLWADDGVTPASVNGTVYRIDDKSGNSFHARQATAARQAILRQSGATYYLECDGIDDYYTTAAGVFQSLAGGGSGYAVASSSVTSEENIHTMYLGTTSNKWFIHRLGTPTNTSNIVTFRSTVGYNDSSAAVLSNGVPFAGIASWTDTTIESYVDGSSNGSSAVVGPLNVGSRGLYVCSREDLPTSVSLTGRYYGGAGIDRPFTAGEISNLTTWLQGLYA